MAWKRHLWSTNLVLATFLRFDDLIISYFMFYSPYLPNLGCLSHPNGLEEAPVVDQPGSGQLVDIGGTHHWPSPVH